MLICVPGVTQLFIPTVKVSDGGMCGQASDPAAKGRKLPLNHPLNRSLSLCGVGTLAR